MLLKGGTLAHLHPPALARADLRTEGGTIVARGARLTLKRDEAVEDCRGRLVLPGFVCAHTHMYSALARGMPGPVAAPASFPDLLRRVWWRLDESLTEEAIFYSAMIGAVEGLRAGTTTLIDHHASPNAIPGSLDIIREAFAVVGVRGVLCYEVTDRGGLRRRDAGLAENDRFLTATRADAQFRGLVGAHAGQGPEHSSARLERYLQLCAEHNIQVVVPSTPAQFFHMIRRQILRPMRKPLIVMTPKSLLRRKESSSALEELGTGGFRCVIGDPAKPAPKKVKRVVFCSGKVYFDIAA